MKPFIPLFVGLVGWFLVAAVVLATFVTPAPRASRPMASAPQEDGVIQVAPPR